MLPYSIETVLSLFGYACYLRHPFPGFHKVDLRLYSLIILCESPLCQKFKYTTFHRFYHFSISESEMDLITDGIFFFTNSM